MTINVLDLFSGIGGFSLGLDRTGGFQTVAFCEIDKYARRVLANHWPEIPIYDDVKNITADRLRADGISVYVVCGGFPCQDISLAGSGAGLDGARSGLWFEMLRIITETRPRFVVAENVAALRSRGLDEVLRGLAAIGYDAEWHCIPAAAVGAPHRRDRVWIIARPHNTGEARPGCPTEIGARQSDYAVGSSANVADSDRAGLEGRIGDELCQCARKGAFGEGYPCEAQIVRSIDNSDWWIVESDVGRVANGVPSRVDRLRCIGNAVVPQIPEMIGRAILSSYIGAQNV